MTCHKQNVEAMDLEALVDKMTDSRIKQIKETIAKKKSQLEATIGEHARAKLEREIEKLYKKLNKAESKVNEQNNRDED